MKSGIDTKLFLYISLALSLCIFLDFNFITKAQVPQKTLQGAEDVLLKTIGKKCKCPSSKRWNGKKCVKKTGEEVCTALFAPVCGCDDMTYGNICEANLNGIKKFTDGECNRPSENDPLPVMVE